MYPSTVASTCPQAAFFSFMSYPGAMLRAAASSSTGSTQRSRWSLGSCRNAPLTSPSMTRIATITVWCFWSWLERLLVGSRDQNQGIPMSRCELWETCPRSHKDGTPESIAYTVCSLLVILHVAPVFQHVIHYIVLDLLLFGWIELFSLPRICDVQKPHCALYLAALVTNAFMSLQMFWNTCLPSFTTKMSCVQSGSVS